MTSLYPYKLHKLKKYLKKKKRQIDKQGNSLTMKNTNILVLGLVCLQGEGVRDRLRLTFQDTANIKLLGGGERKRERDTLFCTTGAYCSGLRNSSAPVHGCRLFSTLAVVDHVKAPIHNRTLSHDRQTKTSSSDSLLCLMGI